MVITDQTIVKSDGTLVLNASVYNVKRDGDFYVGYTDKTGLKRTKVHQAEDAFLTDEHRVWYVNVEHC